jgi:hypothetical protein
LEKVTGIGGVFFRANDPLALALWYRQYLGIDLVPETYDQAGWRQEAGPTAFAPFPEDSTYFGNPERRWMINFRVVNLVFRWKSIPKSIRMGASHGPRIRKVIQLSCGSPPDGMSSPRFRRAGSFLLAG